MTWFVQKSRAILNFRTRKELFSIHESLENIVGTSNVSNTFYRVSESCLKEVSRKVFGMDRKVPFIVAKPRSIRQIQKIIKYANRNQTSVFVRGGGSGYFGGDIPTKKGIVIETSALTRIREFDQEDGCVTCESGIRVAALNNFLKKHDFWWPHNPGSREWATVGGSLASLGVGTFSCGSDTLQI